MDLQEIFEKHDDEYLKFDQIDNPPSKRPDLCAFLLLDKLVPSTEDIITASEHDEFFLSIDCNKLSEIATENDIIYLIRCGIRYDSNNECLAMFS